MTTTASLGADSRRQQLMRDLERSRVALHRDMTHDDAPDAAESPATTEHPLWTMGSMTVARWWEQHPLYATALQAESNARVAIQPTADKHPLALMGAAAFAGGVLACFLPRRLRMLAVPYFTAQATALAVNMTKGFFGPGSHKQ